ncbi:MAG: response regulator [Spirochaetales bacterium]|nr:response regulator [Spirochaetales bacterium]
MENNKFILIMYLSLFIFFVNFIYSCQYEYNEKKQPFLKNGIMYVNNWNFKKDGIIKLDGEWEFYWKQLLEPGDFKNKEKIENPGLIQVPGRWNNFEINNNKIGRYGYATYRIRIKALESNPLMGIKIQNIYASYKIWINNELSGELGNISKSRRTEIPGEIPTLFYFYPAGRDIEIVIQVSNFIDIDGGICFPILFGDALQLQKERIINLSFDVALFGAIFIFGIYHVGLFLFRKKDFSPLFFSFFCFAIALRVILIGEHFLVYLFPDIGYEVQKKIEYLSMYMGLPIFMVFFYLQYPEEIYKPVLYVVSFVCTIFVIITMVTGKYIYVHTLYYYQAILVLSGCYVILILIKCIMKKKEGAVLFVIGFSFLFLGVIFEILFINLVLKLKFYVPLGLFIFILAQSFILSKRYARAFSAVEAASNELELKVIERTKQLEYANKQKTNFFINLAHETKTPLTIISNYLDRYIQKTKMNNELHIIKKNIDKLKYDMINFLDEEKINRGEIKYTHNHIIDLSQFMLEKANMYKVVALQKNINLVYNIEDNCFIKSDNAAIERIINNLFSNALKYTGHNGVITITLKNAGDKITAAIQDTGIGIPEHQLEKIFLPYYQIPNNESTIQGTGIGLYIVKEIVKSLNGEIKVKSEPGRGTEFTIIFNQYILQEGKERVKKQKSTFPAGSQIKTSDILKDSQYDEEKNTILLVEDNYELLAFLMDELSIIYNIYYAKDGYEALNKLYRMPKPDIIISDIMMDKMDGLQLYAVIQENTMFNDIPLVFLTAKTSEKDRITGLKKGAIDYICKPFSLPELKAKIKTIIDNKQKIRKSGMHEAITDMEKNIEIFKNRIKNGRKKQDMDYYGIKHKCKEAHLTKREEEILFKVLKGLEYKQIAVELHISIKTVDKHIQKLHKKFHVQSNIELVTSLLK